LKFVTVSELRAQAPKIVAELETTGKNVIVTKKGQLAYNLLRLETLHTHTLPPFSGPEYYHITWTGLRGAGQERAKTL
jgi:hypothetical protein